MPVGHTAAQPAPTGTPPPTVEASPQLPGGLGGARHFDPAWCLVVDGNGADGLERAGDTLLTLGDGTVATNGAPEERGADPDPPAVLASGVYEPDPTYAERLLPLPSWCSVELPGDVAAGRRTLDLRDGLLLRHSQAPDGSYSSVRFACEARPGTAVMVAHATGRLGHSALARPGRAAATVGSPLGGGVAVASDTSVRGWGGLVVERIASHVRGGRSAPSPSEAEHHLRRACALGPAGLLDEQRTAWSARWSAMDVEVVGDPTITLAARYALFQLLGSTPGHGEAAVGARGITGPAYAGHVFWDTDAFVLPVLAALDRRRSRAVLEYRLRRLDAACRRAATEGRRGARFPWESAHSGDDVTPTHGLDHRGELVEITNGKLEEHITADVSWAAWRHAAWGGDWGFLQGPGLGLLVETARYWESRAVRDATGAHLLGVTGPDEYHPAVDDNAFTNLMARWNLQRAAELCERTGTADPGEVRRWRRLAEELIDQRQPRTGRYEQFTGYDGLEPLLVSAIGEPPVSADLALGPGLARTQIIKQADVLMAHALVPEVTAPGSLSANLDHYLPRTAHGSSLSPTIHAMLLARAGRVAEALNLLRLATSIDLDDLTETTAGGLHLANLAGVWLALVHGFAGVDVRGPDDDALRLRPQLPVGWEELRIRLRWHGRQLRLGCRPDGVSIASDRHLVVELDGERHSVDAPGGWIGRG